MASTKDEIVLSYGDNLIRKSDLQLLDPGEWLNDNIISFWFAYLQNRLASSSKSYCCVCPEMSQFFKAAQQFEMYEDLKEILNREPYVDKDIFFVPINDCDFRQHGGTHWSLLVFHRNAPRNSKAEHFDSSKSSNIEAAKTVANILDRILDSTKEQSIDVIQRQCISQKNGYDCGIHLLCNVEALIRILILGEQKSLAELTNSMINSKRSVIKKTIFDLNSSGDLS